MRAVLYCRVSTTEQAQNLSLSTQEEACREYCDRQGYTVDAVFVDAGESAKTTDRPKFREMLEHCRRGRGRLHAVVVYSLTRFSRNSTDHHAIAAALRGLGIALRSVTEPIDDTPSGRLMEGILASMAQFDNDVRSERVTAGMKAAVDRGRWVWPAPLGYLNGRRGGPSLVPDPDRAAAVREAFVLCAAGVVGAALLQRVRDMRLTTKHGRTVSQSRLYELLRQPVYAGIVRTAAWRKDQRGDFEPLVDAATFARAQAQMSRPVPGPPAAPTRGPLPKDDQQLVRDSDERFPLRRFARCATCGRGLTGSLSRGRNGNQYAFYHCTRGCVRIAKAAFEQQFVDVLDQLRPHPALWTLFRRRVRDGWRGELEAARDRRAAARRRLTTLEAKLTRLEDAFIYQQAIDQATYAGRRDALRADIAIETMAVSEASEETLDVEGMLAFAEHVLQHAGALWTSATCTARRIQLQWALLPGGILTSSKGVIEPPNVLGFLPVSVARPDEKGMVDHPEPIWNPVRPWLVRICALRAA